MSSHYYGSYSSQSTKTSFDSSQQSSGIGTNEATPATARIIQFVMVRNTEDTASTDDQSQNLDYMFDSASADINYIASKIKPMAKYRNYEIRKSWCDPIEMKDFYGRRGNGVFTYPSSSSGYGSQPSQSPFDSPAISIIFVIGSFKSPIFTELKDRQQSIISPLVVNYWRQLIDADSSRFDINTILKRANSMGLFSEAMIDNVIYFSKAIPRARKLELYEMVTMMGGNVEGEFSIRITHVVIEEVTKMGANGSEDPVVNAAHFFQVPVVNISWINGSWSPLQHQAKFAFESSFVQMHKADSRLINLKPKQPPVLQNKIIGVLRVGDRSDNNLHRQMDILQYQLHETVTKFAGKFVIEGKDTSHNLDNAHVLVHIEDIDAIELTKVDIIYEQYSKDRTYMKMQEKRRIPLVRLDWLIQTIIKEKLQPFDDFRINGGGDDGSQIDDDEEEEMLDTSQYADQVGWMTGGGGGGRSRGNPPVLIMQVEAPDPNTSRKELSAKNQTWLEDQKRRRG